MKKKKGISPKDLTDIVRCRNLGMSYQEIATKYNVNIQTVRNWISTLKRQGVRGISTGDKTKIKYVLQLLDIDIEDKKSIQRTCDEVMIRLAQGGINPPEAKIMAQGVEWYLTELQTNIKKRHDKQTQGRKKKSIEKAI